MALSQLATMPKEVHFDDQNLTVLWKDGFLSKFDLLDLRKKMSLCDLPRWPWREGGSSYREYYLNPPPFLDKSGPVCDFYSLERLPQHGNLLL